MRCGVNKTGLGEWETDVIMNSGSVILPQSDLRKVTTCHLDSSSLALLLLFQFSESVSGTGSPWEPKVLELNGGPRLTAGQQSVCLHPSIAGQVSTTDNWQTIGVVRGNNCGEQGSDYVACSLSSPASFFAPTLSPPDSLCHARGRGSIAPAPCEVLRQLLEEIGREGSCFY